MSDQLRVTLTTEEEGIPLAFIVGKDGKLAWHGNPNDKDFDKQLLAALDTQK